MAGYRAARRQPRRGRPVLAIGLITVSAIVAGFLLGVVYRAVTGVGADPSTSASATLGASPTASSSAQASASLPASSPSADASASGAPGPVVEAPEGIVPSGSAVRVVTDGLRLRAQPSTEAEVVADLPASQILVVGLFQAASDWGPVAAGGFDWYPVARVGDATELPDLPELPLASTTEVGWVAAGDAEEAFIELVDVRCPSGTPDLATVEGMLPWELLACFGNAQLTLEGTFGCGGCDGQTGATYEPEWLAHPFRPHVLSSAPGLRGIGPFAFRLAPDGPERPDEGAIVRVAGHFDDPAADGCRVDRGIPPVPLDERAAEVYCREQFVVESIEVIGTDPDFP